MIGTKYNMLTVIDFVQKPNSSQWYAKCKCDCGKEKLAFPYQLRSGSVKSCGCLKAKHSKNFGSMQPLSKGNLKDGRSKHPLYGAWKQMISRCENPKTNFYDRYGGRGISVCEEWHDFWEFVAWSDSVGGRPDGYSIDRINNDGNYEPSNCKWSDQSTQTRNTSRNIIVEYNGVSKPLIDWSIETGINHQTLANRYNRGWSAKRIIETSVTHNNGNKTRFLPVIQSEKDGTIICKHDNISSIPPEYNKKCVSECCCGRKKMYKGYIWRYEGE